MHLLNGNTAPRVRNSEGCTVLDCGCAHTDAQWLQLCDIHFHEWSARHTEAVIPHVYREVAT